MALDQIKELLDVVKDVVEIVGAPVAAVWALAQFRDSVNVRRRELRWKKAELARKLLDDLFDDEDASRALSIIDGEEDSVRDETGEMLTLVAGDLATALRGEPADFTKKSVVIRRCMDSLLYFFERFEQSIDIGLCEPRDLQNPSAYYAEQLAEYKGAVKAYAERVHFQAALHFLDRFKAWRSK